MSAFLSPLRVEFVNPWEYYNTVWCENDGVDRWQLTEPFLYYSSLLKKTVEVPAGFRFDKASVPVVPFIYDQFGGRYTKAACVHDFLVRDRRYPRAKCDRVFLEAMQTENQLELEAMEKAGEDDDEIAAHRAQLEARAKAMYAAVCLYTKTGLWKTEVDRPGFEPIG